MYLLANWAFELEVQEVSSTTVRVQAIAAVATAKR
jgi:hypothetical protein